MSDRPYTDDDLRAEAASQHAALLRDPDFMGIGEHMDDDAWRNLSPDDFEAAQRAVNDLLTKAADVSEWAINLGADGLEPVEHQIGFKAGERPIVRIHFAFAPQLSDDARDTLVQGIGETAAREMKLALDEPTEVTIPAETAAHVLWQERLGGWPPSTFSTKLLNAWTSADTPNAERLAAAFPEYAAAIALIRSGQQGIEQLRAIAGDS